MQARILKSVVSLPFKFVLVVIVALTLPLLAFVFWLFNGRSYLETIKEGMRQENVFPFTWMQEHILRERPIRSWK